MSNARMQTIKETFDVNSMRNNELAKKSKKKISIKYIHIDELTVMYKIIDDVGIHE